MNRVAMICAATALVPVAAIAQTVSPPTKWEDVPDARLTIPAAPPAGVTWQRPAPSAATPAPLPPITPRAAPPAAMPAGTPAPPPLPPIQPRATPPAPPAVAARPLPPSSAPAAPAPPVSQRQAEARPAPPPAAHAERAPDPSHRVETRRIERIHPGWNKPDDHVRDRHAERGDRGFYGQPRHHGHGRWRHGDREHGWAARDDYRAYEDYAEGFDDYGDWEEDIAWHDGYPMPPAPPYPPYWGYGHYGYAPGGMVTITETITTTKPRMVETKRVVKHGKAPAPKTKTKRRAPSKL